MARPLSGPEQLLARREFENKHRHALRRARAGASLPADEVAGSAALRGAESQQPRGVSLGAAGSLIRRLWPAGVARRFAKVS